MSKKNRNIVVAVIILASLIFIMILSNSQSPLVRQLNGPTEGAENVLTIGDKLFVISKNNQVFTWQWNDLKIWPTVAKLSAIVITPFVNDKIIYNPSSNPAKLIFTNLKADTELGGLSLPYSAECKAIKTSQNGKFGIVSVNFKEGTKKGMLKLGVFNESSKEPSFVFQKDTNAENFAIYDFAITNDGNLLAGAGEKGKAWVFVSDVNNQSILWEKTFDKYSRFTRAGFSPDGKLLFVAEKVRHILALDTATGELIKEFIIDEYQSSSNQKQSISCIAISPSGKILAANTEPAGTVYLWDVMSGLEIGEIAAGSGQIISGIAFSPDSKLFVTGGMVNSEIKVWKVPELKITK